MQNSTNFHAHAFGYGGWKYYNTIKKKAMEQEFSWSGLLISLSIAFFIVLLCAQILSFTYESFSRTKEREAFLEQKVYYLEDLNHLNTQTLDVNKLNNSLVNLNIV